MRLQVSSLSFIRRRFALTSARALHTRRRSWNPHPIPEELFANVPTPKGPKITGVGNVIPDPNEYVYGPVKSAHMIDVASKKISDEDAAVLDAATGVVTHGRYGALDADATAAIPLEYLALLHPAAEGAAAVRKITSSSQVQGTILVHNMSEANALSAVQIAQASGQTVVGVVGSNHSHSDDWLEFMKGIVNEPGTAVPQEYAMVKKNFADLVQGIVSGDEGFASYSQDERLEEFKQNLLAYTEMYPQEMPAAVNPKALVFEGMEKDREQFRANIETYLSQLPPGAPPVSSAQLDASFTNEQYQVFRDKFWKQTSGVIFGDDLNYFSPPHIVQDLLKKPEEAEKAGDSVSFTFSHLSETKYPDEAKAAAGGPILGAIIAVTPALEKAAAAVEKAKTIREKAEALQFLTDIERSAFTAATSVASIAAKAGAPIITVGGKLPGTETAEVTPEDVTAALNAMDIQEDGSSNLNYFVHVFRANDFPFYGDYAIHRATEVNPGPRQSVVTK